MRFHSYPRKTLERKNIFIDNESRTYLGTNNSAKCYTKLSIISEVISDPIKCILIEFALEESVFCLTESIIIYQPLFLHTILFDQRYLLWLLPGRTFCWFLMGSPLDFGRSCNSITCIVLCFFAVQNKDHHQWCTLIWSF